MSRTVLYVPPDDSSVLEAQTTQILFYDLPSIRVVSIPQTTTQPILAKSETVVVYPVTDDPQAFVFPQIDNYVLVAPAEQGPPGIAGPPGGDSSSWVAYVANFDPANPPTFVETIAAGDVYQYTYANGTLYRLIGSANDEFYTTFVSPNISGLVVGRAATI
jgi:hypothetical protein